ncbi:hypothetical protein INT45_012658 [Circinella minor]|uniref:WW domain-containing protein n=1 Tax=Circinella minor TaxID=1195481 RepID=A0A8H7VJP7_9FUNG|nr:hypothetical protein INT45_012658 [Circinella minor]
MSTKESSNPSSPTQQPIKEKSPSVLQEEESSSSKKLYTDPSTSDVDHSTETKKETTSTTSSKTDDASAKSNVDQAWIATWDENNQAYYWWNTVTYETTWEDPFLKLDDNKEGKEGKEGEEGKDKERQESPTVAGPNPSFSSANLPYYQQQQQQQQYPYYPQQEDYTYQAHFNTRTGKFQAASDLERLNPERMSLESRATRQMNYYFDVDSYTEQRNSLGVSQSSKQRLSKKELQKYKKAKLEKKMKKNRDWLRD